jgi:hypothetical protein
MVIDNGYHFDETEKNRLELQRYKEESDTVLSFIADCVEVKDGSCGAFHGTFQFIQEVLRGLRYKGLCAE